MGELKHKAELFTKGFRPRNPYCADRYAFIEVRVKRTTRGIVIPPFFRAYFNDGVTCYDYTPPDGIRQKAQIITLGVTAFIKDYSGAPSVILLTDNMMAVEWLMHLESNDYPKIPMIIEARKLLTEKRNHVALSYVIPRKNKYGLERYRNF